MITTSFSPVIDEEGLRLDPIRVGGVHASLSTPDRFVLVLDSGRPVLRVDVYSFGPDSFVFQEAIVWRGLLVIGFGSHVHAISMADQSARMIELGSYFGRLHPMSHCLLITSGERLFCMDPDRGIRWTSDMLGIDGVIVHEPISSVIRGEGEWDPPGGWKPFAISAIDGTSLSA